MTNMTKTHEKRTETHASDLIGKKYGMLTVMEFASYHITPCGTRRRLWKCRCDCGAEKIVQEPNLKNGTTKSCGCWKYQKIKEHNTKHGGVGDRLYGIWKNMKRRCNSPKDSHYVAYGGKGIKVCDEWANDYAVFKEWAYKNGYDENAKTGDCSIDRINNNGNYEPNNCRWVNRIQQANNTSQNRYVTLNGKQLTIAEFARTMNISPFKARYRIELFEKGDRMENKFPPEFMNVMRRLLLLCAKENTDTICLEFETSNGAKWSVEMTFSVEGDEDDG